MRMRPPPSDRQRAKSDLKLPRVYVMNRPVHTLSLSVVDCTTMFDGLLCARRREIALFFVFLNVILFIRIYLENQNSHQMIQSEMLMQHEHKKNKD
jgi:hypothetical protein